MNYEYPWHKEYRKLGIPNSYAPYPDKPVYDILYRTATKYKKMGFIQNGFKLTYPELKEDVEKLATALSKIDIKEGDRVVTVLPTSIQFVVADYAISMAGLVHVPCSELESLDSIQKKFKECSPRLLFCMDSFLGNARQLKENSSIEYIICSAEQDYSLDQPKNYKEFDTNDCYWMRQLVADNESNPPKINIDIEKDIETLLFTGGTTGLAKGCMLTHRNVYANAIQNMWVLGAGSTHLMHGAISIILGVPLFHAYGHSMLHSMQLLGFDIILITDARDTKIMTESLKKYYPVLQLGVPTQFMKLATEDFNKHCVLGVSGSAALPPSAQKNYDNKGSGIVEGFGISEMTATSHINTTLLDRVLGGSTMNYISNLVGRTPIIIPIINKIIRLMGSRNYGFIFTKILYILMKISKTSKKLSSKEKRACIGVPFPDVEVKFLDIDTEKEISIKDMISGGGKAEMCLNGPQRMLGYWSTPGKGLDENGFVRTGDIVKLDKKGFFYVIDRTKDMINVSGFKVYSREIDDILYEYPGVELPATIGIPDPEREGSERVVVFIQLKKDFKDKITENDIISYLKSKVAKYAVPKKVYIIDHIPLTKIQKVDKKELLKNII